MLVVVNIRIPESEFEFGYARGSGPGGQNVNKVNSKVVLTWNCQTSPSLTPAVKKRFLERYASRLRSDGAVVISSDRFRDQKRNADDCRDKLAAMIEEVRLAPIERRPTKPTRGSKERRLQTKSRDKAKKESRRKVDY
ncbi:MAG: aminoacyl-tRNA hydrolase [Deltaproteobacteria bacterium]|nr:aminoacyl-tRNA hydrolase [Deltaproteobacteria bacterium]